MNSLTNGCQNIHHLQKSNKNKKISTLTDRWHENEGSIANEKAMEPLFLILIVKLKKNKKKFCPDCKKQLAVIGWHLEEW